MASVGIVTTRGRRPIPKVKVGNFITRGRGESESGRQKPQTKAVLALVPVMRG